MANGHPKARRRAVVENVNREAIESDDLGKTLDHASYIVECIAEPLSRRHRRLAEAGQVRRDEVEFAGKQRNQVAEHVARSRKAVQQKQLRRTDILRLAIEHLDAVDISRTVID